VAVSWVCWQRSWCVAKNCDWWWKLAFSIYTWNATIKHGTAQNKFSPEEVSQVEKPAHQDNAKCFLRCWQNYARQVCLWRHNSKQSILFRGDGTSACMHRVNNGQFHSNSWLLLHDTAPTHCTLNVKQFLASKSICVFQASPLLARYGIGTFFSSWRWNWP
jgi:hypothetical protein